MPCKLVSVGVVASITWGNVKLLRKALKSDHTRKQRKSIMKECKTLAVVGPLNCNCDEVIVVTPRC